MLHRTAGFAVTLSENGFGYALGVLALLAAFFVAGRRF